MMWSIFVGFAESSFQPFVKVEAFAFSDVLGFVGGIMGLIAGVSVLSLVEILYHMVDVLQMKIRLKLRKRRVACDQSKKSNRVIGKVINANQNHALYQLSKFVGQFMKTSDAHGFSYILDKNQSVLGRLFWALAVAASVAACTLLTFSAFENAELNPVAIKIDDEFVNVENVSWKFELALAMTQVSLSDSFPCHHFLP
jgi:Amiloride-sensitive sodium channel